MQIKIQKLSETAKIPTRGSNSAAGYDLYLDSEGKPGKGVAISPEKSVLLSTGIALEIPEGYFGAIYARSGLASKQHLRPSNCVGVIDSDYRGVVKVSLHNDSMDKVQFVEWGERIAQLVIQKFEEIEFDVVEELSDSLRGQGGFGSTGEK